ncbi:MAG TPA: HAMP domain-containing sensor histidine kinase [Kofleriaceae bacterium]|nr:HAMP domain-containing sensor histidine kinase [Kofleriaceae bacterium]
MLHEFIATHREEIIVRTRERVMQRLAPRPTAVELAHGVPLFLDQLSTRLQIQPENEDISTSASLRGAELLDAGLSIGQVVHDYGNICQSITDLAVDLGDRIPSEDFRTLNLCLDVAIADSVAEFSRRREKAIAGRGIEQLGALAHELRNFLATAILAFDAIRSGGVGINGSTGTVLERSLLRMSDLVTRSLAEVRIDVGSPNRDRVSIADLVEEIEIAASLQAKRRSIRLVIEPVARALEVEGDVQILASIVTNLVQNAVKFTHEHGQVVLHTRLAAGRVLIDVADECGGLPAGKAEELFRPYEQRGTDRSGLGLGLSIALKGARAMGGTIEVTDVPGTGCIFTLDLPQAPPA